MIWTAKSLANVSPVLGGRTLGAEHLLHLLRMLRALPAALEQAGRGELLVLDFEGIQTVTSSYFKGLIFPLLSGDGPARSVNAFPVLRGLSPLASEELIEAVAGTTEVVLEARESTSDVCRLARLHGRLDPALLATLRALTARGSATAGDLHKELGGAVNVTAFNNRLADLHSKRLARRYRAVRSWVYEPVAKEIADG